MSYCVATCAGEERPRRRYASASMFATGVPDARCSQASRLWALAHDPSARRGLRLPGCRGCCSARDSSGRSAPTVEPEASVKLCVRQGSPVGERREVAEAAGHGADEQRTSSPPCAARGEGERGERVGGRGNGSRRRSAGGRERGEERGRSRHLYRATGRVEGVVRVAHGRAQLAAKSKARPKSSPALPPQRCRFPSAMAVGLAPPGREPHPAGGDRAAAPEGSDRGKPRDPPPQTEAS